MLAAMRLVEIRLLEGPNLYRLAPAVKLEVALGRRRTWFGQRTPERHALVRLSAPVARAAWPAAVADLVAWVERLRRGHGEGRGGIRVHRSSDPGHWIVVFPWVGAERAREIADAAFQLADRGVSPRADAPRTPRARRLIERLEARITAARVTPPQLIRDADRRMPAISISGTNGKTTVTRLITHILLLAGHHVGTTTSDGILVDERVIDAGDWTGPGGALQILGRSDVDIAVLETARGGLLLRGVGYESNDASVLTNISSDHLDVQGIHTLPELAEVKAVIARMTRPEGWVVLNADDPLLAAVARRVRAHVAFFSMAPSLPPVARRNLARGGRAYLVERDRIVEREGDRTTPIVAVADVPIALCGLARHNVANALAAAAGARGLGATIAEVAAGLRDFRPSVERSPGRLNIFRLGNRIVIVDFAHNEAGLSAVLDVAEGIAAGGAGRAAPITAIVGTAGDRPDDTLRGIGRIAGLRAQRVAIKETPHYLRGRTRESIIGELLGGITAAGVAASAVPVYPSESIALRTELAGGPDVLPPGARPTDARVVVLMTHEERDAVYRLIEELGGRPVDVASELTALVPRLQERPRRH
jgi:cyanophycin synthetase